MRKRPDRPTRRVDLSGAQLRDADLREVSLRGADLVGVDLRGARLTDADFTNADLTNANLTGADLHGAVLSGAVLRGANLQEAKLSVDEVPGGRARVLYHVLRKLGDGHDNVLTITQEPELYHVAVGQPDFHRIRTEAATKLAETLLGAAEVVKGLV